MTSDLASATLTVAGGGLLFGEDVLDQSGSPMFEIKNPAVTPAAAGRR